MALSGYVRRLLGIAMGCQDTARELCDAVDAGIPPTLAGNNTFTGANTFNGGVTLGDGDNVAVGTGTGTQFGTSASQKLAWFGATPAVQQAGNSDVLGSLVTLGLRAASSNPPLNLGTGALTCGTATVVKLELGPAPADTYAAAMTIDVTKSLHVVAASFTTSATVTFTPSAHGTAGDVLVLRTAADASGDVTATFASTFHASGTQVTTASTFSTIVFISDGTRWCEVCRTTALA